MSGGLCLKEAVKLCYAETVELILSNNSDVATSLLCEIDDDVIEYLFSFDIDEETLETIRVLFNYDINPKLFSKYLGYLQRQDENHFNIKEDNQDLIIELIDILVLNDVRVE
jgi:hypothetical protein